MTTPCPSDTHTHRAPSGSAAAREAPLSPGQQALWLVHLLEPGTSVYNLAVTLRLDERLGAEQARQVLGRLVARHPVLATTYHLDGGDEPVQREHPGFVPPLEVADSTSAVHTAQLVSGAVDLPFDLAAAPPVRALLVQEPSGSSVLSLVIHHIAVDGPSRQIIAADLLSLRDGVELPDAPPPYREFALASTSAAARAAAAAGVGYWTAQLAGCAALQVPAGHLGASPPTSRPGRSELSLDAATTAALQRIAFRCRATMYALLASALAGALAELIGVEDVSFGSVLSGRRHPRYAGTVGFFVNTVVLRCPVRPGDTPRDLITGMQAVTSAAAAHQATPFGEVVRALAPARDGARNPLFEIVFVYDGDVTGATPLPAGAHLLDDHREDVRFDFEIATEICDGRLDITIRYRSAVYDGRTAARVGALFEQALHRIRTGLDVPRCATAGSDHG